MHRRDFLTTLSGSLGAAGLGATGLGAAGVAGLLGGCGPIEVVPDPNSKKAKAERRKVMATVLYARRAGLQRHHMGPSLRPWATNGTLTIARDRSKGPHDLVLDHDHLVDRALHRYHGPAPQARMVRFTTPRLEITGSDARFEFTSEIIDITRTLWLREAYELWLSPVGWIIVKGRRWPLREKVGGATARFGTFEWRSRDSLVQAARTQRDGELVVKRLLEAWRFADAWNEAQQITDEQDPVYQTLKNPGRARRWSLRGEVAVELGLASKAVAAYKKALSLDAFVKTAKVKAADDARVSIGQ